MVSRLVRAPAARTPRAARTPAVPTARGSVPDVEDRPRSAAHRPPRQAEAVLAGLRRYRDRPRGADDSRHDGPPRAGGDARPERLLPEQPSLPRVPPRPA